MNCNQPEVRRKKPVPSSLTFNNKMEGQPAKVNTCSIFYFFITKECKDILLNMLKTYVAVTMPIRYLRSQFSYVSLIVLDIASDPPILRGRVVPTGYINEHEIIMQKIPFNN